jgi:tyrosine decarboxylase / aspartate 1-decarboxylase
MYWPQLSQQKLQFKVYQALSDNVNYTNGNILGVPGSFLDSRAFEDGSIGKEIDPFISVVLANPNHTLAAPRSKTSRKAYSRARNGWSST